MLEAQSGRIIINDHKVGTIEEVLHFIYTGKVKKMDEENVEDIFRAADQFLLKGLKRLCELFLMSRVTLDNAIEMLALGHMYSADELKKTAKQIIVEAGTGRLKTIPVLYSLKS